VKEHDVTHTLSKNGTGPAPVIRIEQLRREYRMGSNVVVALRGLDLEIWPGEMVSIMAPSGSGKSTLLNVLGCLDRPTAGRYWLDGQPVSELSESALATVRNRKIGFVFQTFNLLPRATALKNVMLPLLYAGITGPPARERCRQALAAVGLSERMNHRPTELSGGQQQRVAIARALVNGPSLLLADEPTGNLDSRTSIEVMEIFQELNDDGMTVVLVTHEPDIASFCGRQITMHDGGLVGDERNPDPVRARALLASSEVAA
jgi:putative ABC transport system ATP-binding protein